MASSANDLQKQLLLSEKLLDARGARAASERVAETGEDFFSACWALKLVPERALARLLAGLHGCPGVDLSLSVVRVANLEIIPEEVVRKQLVLPVLDSGFEIVLAMADPTDDSISDELRFLSDRKVLRHVAVREALRAAIEGTFKARLADERFWRGRAAWKLDPPAEGRAEVVPPAQVKVPSPKAPAPAPAQDDAAWLDGFLGASVSPAPRRAPPPPPPPGATGTSFRDKTVLVVDDDSQIRALAIKLLEPFECSVLQAGDGKEALALIRARKPDVVLLDVMLPGMHGFEICRAIKGDAELRHAGVVMMSGIYTGWKAGTDPRQAYGADEFFEKPFSIPEVAAAVQRLLARSAAPAAPPPRPAREDTLATCRDALARAQAGRHADAIALLLDAGRQDPFAAEPFYFLGLVQHEAGEPYHAVAALERAAELRPDLERALSLLAELYWALGFRKEAVAALRRARDASADPARTRVLDERLASISVA